MGYNVRLPLVFGELKIKSYSRLRVEERDKLVPVHKIGQTYYIWRSYSRSANPAKMVNRYGSSSAVDTKVADRLRRYCFVGRRQLSSALAFFFGDGLAG